MIPRKIHYCWFGQGNMADSIQMCIDSWIKHLPEYELVLWNEENFDVNSNPYVKEAYEAKKFAFVTDYVRLYSLYEYGGIYMDTDVEVIKSLDPFLHHRAFTGCENEFSCVTGTMAAEAKHPWIEKLLSYYEGRNFILPDGSFDLTTNTEIITNFTKKEYNWKPENAHQKLKDDLHIYPFDFFCAKVPAYRNLYITENTHTIHHFSGSWVAKTPKDKLIKLLGPRITKKLVTFKRLLKKNDGF